MMVNGTMVTRNGRLNYSPVVVNRTAAMTIYSEADSHPFVLSAIIAMHAASLKWKWTEGGGGPVFNVKF